MAPPHPKMTADYLLTELGLVEGKETFEARSLGRLAEVSEGKLVEYFQLAFLEQVIFELSDSLLVVLLSW
jgi:hypothetical protein